MPGNVRPVHDVFIEDRGLIWKIRITIPDDLPPVATLEVIAEVVAAKHIESGPVSYRVFDDTGNVT